MSDPIWRLPSVERFFASVADHLEAGMIVIVHVAPHTPSEIAAALRQMISEDLRHKDLIDVTTNLFEYESVAALVNNFACVALRVSNCAVSSVAELSKLANQRIYCIEGIDDASIAFWRFLEAFRLENHSRPEFDRDTFLIFLNGKYNPPKFDVGLKVLRWEGVVREIDGLTFLNDRVADGRESELYATVKMRILIELAGTDLGLLDYLSGFSLSELVTPMKLLKAYAAENDWMNGKLCSWNDGGEDLFNASRRIHSCCHALRDDDSEISRRVWRGQIVSLFPYIEERRIELGKRLIGFVSEITFTHHFTGEIVDFWDLDIGPMYFIARNTLAPSRIKGELEVCRDVRHYLAHLQPVPCDLVDKLISFQTSSSNLKR